jgi:glycosyltransferase involved in cell wall biosynthesis
MRLDKSHPAALSNGYLVGAGRDGLTASHRQSVSCFEHPNLTVRMGKPARKRVETAFSWEAHVDAYDRLYRQLINDRTISSKPSLGQWR